MWYGHGMQSELVISLNHVLVPIQDLSQPLLWALYLSQFFVYRTQLVFHVLVSEASECANSNNVTLPPPLVTQSQQLKMPIPGRTWFTLSLWRNLHTVPFAMWRSCSGNGTCMEWLDMRAWSSYIVFLACPLWMRDNFTTILLYTMSCINLQVKAVCRRSCGMMSDGRKKHVYSYLSIWW